MTPLAAEARVTKLTITQDAVVDLPTFGMTGAYRKISGTFEGELEVDNPRNAVIADLALALQTRGRVHYRSTFYILRPADPAKWNGRLFYMFSNRGLKLDLRLNDAGDALDPSTIADFGNAWLNRQGYAFMWSGWDGTAAPGPGKMSIDLPVAKGPGGATITGKVAMDFTPASADPGPLQLFYPVADPASGGVLTMRQHDADKRIPVTGWRYLDATHIRVDGQMHPEWIYEFVYMARDPKVMGIGHAATRDLVTFLRQAEADDAGVANPLARPGAVKAVYSFGRSQSGRVQRDFLYWGFNETEAGGRKVFDGMIPYSAGAGVMWMNQRFAQPTVSRLQHLNHHVIEAQFPHAFQVSKDPLTGAVDGLEKRCAETDTCPKIISIDSANEYWMKSSSLRHTDAGGADIDTDKVAPNTRLYLIASSPHSTFFGERAKPVAACQQLSNPLYQGPIFRALIADLDDWVTKDAPPPPSRIPTRAAGTLVVAAQVRFPVIPALSYAGYPALPAVQFAPGSISRNLVQNRATVPLSDVPGKEYAVQVPQVDADGNDLAGIRVALLDAPLGTYTGWSLLKPDLGGPDLCYQHGQFIPFAATKADRLRTGDPRLSLEERYPTALAYRTQISAAVQRLIDQRLMLAEDASAVVADAYEQYISHAAQSGPAR